MDKANVFRSGEFFMDTGDILHMLFLDETGVTMDVDLWSADTTTETVPDAPTALDASDITMVSFTANWYFNENTTGYYLDVATDSAFAAMVVGYSNLDVGNVNTYSIIGLSEYTTYYCRLRAYNNIGVSNNSVIKIVTTSISGYDVGGVVTVYTESDHFKKLTTAPYVHSLIYHDDYIYACPLSGNPATGVMELVKIKASDYSVYNLIPIHYSSESDTTEVLSSGQISVSGNYLYIAATVFISGSIPLLIQYDLRYDSYKVFKLDKANGSLWGYPALTDSTHIYFSSVYTDPGTFVTTTKIIKYLLSDFQDPSWIKFNTSYGDTGVPIAPISVTDVVLTDYSYIHSLLIDTTYLYLGVRYSGGTFGAAGKLIQINKGTMVINASADIPNLTDDMAQTSTHIFTGTEVHAEPYTFKKTWTTVAIRKSDMAVTGFLKHSTEAADIDSYCVAILNVSGVDYLFNLRTNGTIYIVDISDPDSWAAVAGDPYIERVLSFVYSDAPVSHYVPNEIVIDGTDTLHVTTWNVIPELLKFKLSPI